MVEKHLYRPREAQETLGIGNTKFYALIKEGKLETRRIGRATVVTAESLRAFIENLPTTSAAKM
ncbi:MAG TPA: helix-turn-helix domain-containing protein [Halothiobacillus sp.]|nr:helix-turn-helix domain-containing protein [Halothiobacillus sp.]